MRSKWNVLWTLAIIVVGTSLVIAATGFTLLEGWSGQPWEGLPPAQQQLARRVFTNDPICSGILGRNARFTVLTETRIAWSCKSLPWGHLSEDEALCVEGFWLTSKYEWQGYPDAWQRVKAAKKGPSC